VLFPSFSRYITSWVMGDISHQPHGQLWRHLEVDATGRDRVYGIWLVVGWLPC
jgi:hypothetical protein